MRVIVVVLSFVIAWPVVPLAHDRGVAADITKSDWLRRTLQQLTLEEKIGQLLQIRVYGDYASIDDPHYRFVRSQIQRYQIGSVELSSRMAGPNLVKPSPLQVATVLNELQRESQLPLLVGGDFERGLASRVSDTPEFPFPMAFGAIQDPAAVEKFAALVAEQARAVGIHWAYAPTADVNSNPANPIINTRSFGEDANQVSKLVAAYVLGAHRNGMLVTAKHFPGQGDTFTDPHIGFVRINAGRKHLEEYELPPFKAAIAAGVDAIMLAHAAVPVIDSDPQRIATTSEPVVRGLLRRELGFRGLVITDALEMAGVRNLYPKAADPAAQAAVDAIKAGADVLMVMEDVKGPFEALLAAVRSGEISESRIDESVRRILAVKASLGLQKSRLVNLDAVAKLFSDNQPKQFAQNISDAAVTLVRNNHQVLPIAHSEHMNGADPEISAASLGSNRLVFVSFSDSQYSPLGREFERQVSLRRPDAVTFHVYNDGIGSAQPSEILSALKAADEVVIAAFLTHVPTRKIEEAGRTIVPVGLLGATAGLLEKVIAAKPANSVVIALGSPYLIGGYPQIENYICTYSLTPTAEVTAAKAIFGEIDNHAKLPVTLPGIARRGFSLPWPGAN